MASPTKPLYYIAIWNLVSFLLLSFWIFSLKSEITQHLQEIKKLSEKLPEQLKSSSNKCQENQVTKETITQPREYRIHGLLARFGIEAPISHYTLLKFSPPALCLDIGANVGFSSLSMIRYQHRVIAFEPDITNFQSLNKTIYSKDLQKNITAYNYGVGSERSTANGEQSFIVNGQSEAKINDGDPPYEVQIVPLDDYVKEHVLFMKIDVQGFEGEVIKGAKQLLENYGVDIIKMEFWPEMKRLPTLRYLYDIGYECYTSNWLFFEDDPNITVASSDAAANTFKPYKHDSYLTLASKTTKSFVTYKMPGTFEGFVQRMKQTGAEQTDLLCVKDTETFSW